MVPSPSLVAGHLALLGQRSNLKGSVPAMASGILYFMFGIKNLASAGVCMSGASQVFYIQSESISFGGVPSRHPWLQGH